jgi:four helix bundle protein
MDANELSWRTKKLGVNIIKLVESLPSSRAAKLIGDHLLRSGLYVSVNYRAACRAFSDTDFISRLGYTIEYVDESLHWLEMLAEADIVSKNKLELLMQEANDLMAVLTTTARTSRESLDRRTQTE